MKKVATTLALVLVLAVTALPANAQEQAVRFYLMPLVSPYGVKLPAHVYDADFNPDGEVELAQWAAKDYKDMGLVILVSEVTPEQHATLASFGDVFAFPENIETNPSPAELSALESYLEAAFVPGNWLSVSDTWRVSMRTVTGMFLFMQRLTVLADSSPLEWGVTLNTQFTNLDAAYQTAIVGAFDGLGYDSTVIKSNWTLRIILKEAADQWGDQPIYFGMATL